MQIYQNFLTNEDKQYIQDKINQPIWKFGHSSINGEHRFWQASLLEFDAFFNPHLINKIQELTGDKLAIERIYFNGHTAGSGGSLHKDSELDIGRTFLIYCNEEWSPEWGGDTLFMDENKTIVHPEPYSAVYFQNNIEHCAMPVSGNFKGLRVTCAFKLVKI